MGRYSLLVVTVILIIGVAEISAASSAAAMEHRSLEDGRRRRFGLSSLLYGHALGWLLAIKLKIVLVAIAVAVAMARGSKFWGPGSWGCSTSYESPGPWVEEYPGPGKSIQERSDNSFESESLTSRVMSGIELAKVSWKAVTESGEQNACRARLTCEARQIAKESPPLAKMLDIIGSSLRPYETEVTNDCEQLGCTSSGAITESQNENKTSVTPLPANVNERPREYFLR